jgi:hypothetical protein
LEWIWKEVVVAYFEVLSRHLRGSTDEIHDKTSMRIAKLFGKTYIATASAVQALTLFNFLTEFHPQRSEVK